MTSPTTLQATDAADFLTTPADVAAFLRVALMEDAHVDTLSASVFTAVRALERMPA